VGCKYAIEKGRRCCFFILQNKEESLFLKTIEVETIDMTVAGDIFCGLMLSNWGQDTLGKKI
jgi:hypothetical protein